MADIFISYKAERRSAVAYLTRVLENYGYSVWFDYGLLSGAAFAPQIEREIRAARAVIVLWCERSVKSRWVLEEADLADEHRTLLPARLDNTSLPMGFRRLDTIDLASWDGNPRSGTDLTDLLDQIALKVGRDPIPNYRALSEQESQWRVHRFRLAQYPLDEKATRIEGERARQESEPPAAGPEPRAVSPARQEAAPRPLAPEPRPDFAMPPIGLIQRIFSKPYPRLVKGPSLLPLLGLGILLATIVNVITEDTIRRGGNSRLFPLFFLSCTLLTTPALIAFARSVGTGVIRHILYQLVMPATFYLAFWFAFVIGCANLNRDAKALQAYFGVLIGGLFGSVVSLGLAYLLGMIRAGSLRLVLAGGAALTFIGPIAYFLAIKTGIHPLVLVALIWQSAFVALLWRTMIMTDTLPRHRIRPR